MYISSSFCAAQERIQRERAANATLNNVRDSAERAAAAWEKEGAEANGREQRTRARIDRAKFSGTLLRSAHDDASAPAATEDDDGPL